MKAYNKIFLNFFSLYIKITTNYYQKRKEKLRKEARERYQSLFEEEKEKSKKRIETDIKIFLKRKRKKRQYHHECNTNLSEKKKKRKLSI